MREQQRQPDHWAYRYPDGIRFATGGRKINGSEPIEVIGVYFAPTVEACVSTSAMEAGLLGNWADGRIPSNQVATPEGI